MCNIYGQTCSENDISDFIHKRFQFKQLEIYYESIGSFIISDIKVKLKVFQIRMRLNEVIHHLNKYKLYVIEES